MISCVHLSLLLSVCPFVGTKSASSPDPGCSVSDKYLQTVQNIEKLPCCNLFEINISYGFGNIKAINLPYSWKFSQGINISYGFGNIKAINLPYSGKFSQGPNFHDFHDPRPKHKNKNHERRTTEV